MIPTDSQKSENLPEAAVAALWKGNKIEAIKIVREARRIDLKTAKDAVEEYVRAQPALQQKFKTANEESKRSLLWVIVILLAAAGIYWLTAR